MAASLRTGGAGKAVAWPDRRAARHRRCTSARLLSLYCPAPRSSAPSTRGQQQAAKEDALEHAAARCCHSRLAGRGRDTVSLSESTPQTSAGREGIGQRSGGWGALERAGAEDLSDQMCNNDQKTTCAPRLTIPGVQHRGAASRQVRADKGVQQLQHILCACSWFEGARDVEKLPSSIALQQGLCSLVVHGRDAPIAPSARPPGHSTHQGRGRGCRDQPPVYLCQHSASFPHRGRGRGSRATPPVCLCQH